MSCVCLFFFFNDTATTEIYTLSLHDALPISIQRLWRAPGRLNSYFCSAHGGHDRPEKRKCVNRCGRSEEHTSELQSQSNLVCRLLLEKKKTLYQTRSRITHQKLLTTQHSPPY